MSNFFSKYVQLKTIVSYFLDQNNMSVGDFDKAWVIGFRAIADIGLNISFEPVSVRLPVNGNFTVSLPSDYIKWTKVGVLNASGEVSTLRVNNSLTKFRDNNPNRIAAITPNIPDTDFNNLVFSPYFLNYFGNNYSPLFGLGGGLVQYGDFTVDEKNRVIVLSETYPFADILLEYISSPEQNEDYQIEIVCQEAVIAFLEWKFRVGSEKDYYSRLIEARRKLKPVTLQEWNQVLRENTKYCLKS